MNLRGVGRTPSEETRLRRLIARMQANPDWVSNTGPIQLENGQLTLVLGPDPSGLATSTDGLTAVVQDVLAIDASGILLNYGTGLENDGADNLQVTLGPFSTDDLSEGATNLYFTDERAQDAVGGILTDSASVTWTYDDAANTISASVNAGAVDHGSLTGLGDDDHTQYHNDARALTWLGTRSTDDLPEGATNLYFTDQRAVDAIAAADTYVLNTGDTMTGTLTLPTNGLVVGTDQLVIVGGRVGIGESSPAEDVDIVADAIRLTVSTGNEINKSARFTTRPYNVAHPDFEYMAAAASDGANDVRFGIGSAGLGYAPATAVSFWTGSDVTTAGFGSRRMAIDSSGRIGINEAAPGAQLDVVNGAAARVALYLEAAGSQSANLLEVRDSGGSLLAHIDANGDLVAQSYTDANRPAAGTAGRIIFNSDDGMLNVDDGTNWTLPDGTTT